MPHTEHAFALLPPAMLSVWHVHLGLHTWVSLKGRAMHIWSFGYDFSCAIIMGYAGLRL